MLRKQLAGHYGVSLGMIDRWFRETGLQPLGRRQAEARVVAGMGSPKPARIISSRDMSLAGRAADFLQKRDAIFRCNERGEFDHKGTFWRWHGRTWDAAQIVEIAEDKGWDRDAWKRIGSIAA